jgi:REP element-mobilizing transposase RayT
MAKMIGFMVTWTTYGTWLQGDKKGYVKNGITLGENARLEKTNRQLLKHDKIIIPKNLRKTVENAILKEAEQIGQKIYAIAICSNHVHIVVESTNERFWYSIGRLKRAATKALREYGFVDKVWTKGYDKRYCYSQDELETRIKYVQRHKS